MGIWAITRHTLAQCLRMRIAVAFILMLAGALLAMPLLLKGDGTLAGKIQTLLSYGSSFTSLLLSLVTIFVSVAVVSSDVRNKQIFITATKPLARWQYVFGRWLGVVLLNVILLGLAGLSVYLLAVHYRSGQALNAADRQKVETELFASRRAVRPALPPVQDEVAQSLQRLHTEGLYEQALGNIMFQTNIDREQAHQYLVDTIRRQAMDRFQTADPGRTLSWRFSRIEPKGQGSSGPAKVANKVKYLYRLTADPELIGQLLPNGPVRVDGTEGRITRLEWNFFDLEFPQDQPLPPKIANLTAGDRVQIGIDPTVQITYRANASGDVPDNVLHSLWLVINPTTGIVYREYRSDTVRQKATLTVPARLVDQNGELEVRYVNMPHPQTGAGVSVTIALDNIGVTYRVGGFDGNFVRAWFLMLLHVSFLAAVGVAAGTFLSFSVGCLVSFSLLPFAMMSEWLAGAIRTMQYDRPQAGAITFVSKALLGVIGSILPDFSKASAGKFLVEATNVSWTMLAETVFFTLLLRTGIVLGVAFLIFHRRELARVQV